MKNISKKYTVYTIISIIALLGVASLLTWAVFFWSNEQNDPNILSTLSCVELSFVSNNDSISLNNTYPMSNSEGLKTTPYIFTVKNECDSYVEYQIIATLTNSSNIPLKYLKVALGGDAILYPSIINSLGTMDTPDGNEYSGYESSSYILIEDNFKEQTSKTYEYRMWLDGDNPAIWEASDISDSQSIKLKLSIVGIVKIKPVYTNYANGTVVYFNPETNQKCNNYVEANSNTGNKSGCLKWYTFNDDPESDTVNLLLDHSTTDKVAWNISGNNTGGPVTVKAQLQSDIITWHSNIKSTARLITNNEVARITGHLTFNWLSPSQGVYYFDTNASSASPTCKSGNTTGCQYGWLYDRTHISCTTTGCLNNANTGSMTGYWTEDYRVGNVSEVWGVNYSGCLAYGNTSTGAGGVRPVINIPKYAVIMYGKSIQNGAPTPNNPVAINSIGDSGEIEIMVENRKYTINLSGHEALRSLPNGIADYLDFTRGKIIRNIARIVINENASISLGTKYAAVTAFYINSTSSIPGDENEGIQILSNLFVGASANDYGNYEHIKVAREAGRITVYIDKNQADTVQAFKSYLSEHPIEIIYRVATPSEENITLPKISSSNENIDMYVNGPIRQNILVVSNIN